MKTDLTEQINLLVQKKTNLQQTIDQHEQIANQTKMELSSNQKEKESIVQQLQTTLAQLHGKLDERVLQIPTTHSADLEFLFVGSADQAIIIRYPS